VSFLALFVSLPTRASSGRMRVWRALKALGTATLRDGVYLLPDSPERAAALEAVGREAREAQGAAEIYRLSGRDEAQELALRARFDRSHDYAAIAEDATRLQVGLKNLDGPSAERRMRSLLRRFDQVSAVDFFPGEPQTEVRTLLDAVRAALTRHVSPDEPVAKAVSMQRLERAQYLGRTWATRRRPWIDRLASAWLIRRHIDPGANIVWLGAPAECRPDWLGFDFDGAAFSHVGARVTFETLLVSFGLEGDPTLARFGELVHCLDVGGLPVAEAPGVEALLTGLRAAQADDDQLLAAASNLFDWLIQSYKEKYRD
jgi:hypothetical protein